MANLTETKTYETGIYKIETTDTVIGGDESVANKQARQLANRTAWLKKKALDELTGTRNTNGYQKLPNSLILQWGQHIVSSDQYGLDGKWYTFPLVFPNAVFSVVAVSCVDNSAARVGTIEKTRFYVSQIDTVPTIRNLYGSFYWMSIGH